MAYRAECEIAHVIVDTSLGDLVRDELAHRFGRARDRIAALKDRLELGRQRRFERVAEIGDFVIDAYKRGEYDKVEIVYNEFKNVATQILRTEQMLPIVAAKENRKKGRRRPETIAWWPWRTLTTYMPRSAS